MELIMGLFDKFKKKIRPRAIVLGLDGVPYTLLEDLKNRGRIPNMASIFERGYFGQMSVCIPEISSVSWSSFMTGSQSGEHGIYGFIDLKPGTYKMYFPNFTHLQGSTLWDELALQGRKAVVINMPATYPARKINGALISGFVAIDINKAVYPSSLIARLNEMDYRIDLDITRARQDHDFLFRDLDATLESREIAVDFLWKEIDWDLFIIVITGTDRLMHFLWDAFENEAHPYHQDFLDYFDKVDSFVGRVFDRFLGLDGSKEEKNQFYMLSDHGFTKIKTEVYLNRWLQENGYLKFNKDQPETIMDIGPESTAFALDPSRIYINLKGKYPLGTIDSADYGRVRKELKQDLEALNFEDGKKVVKKVYDKEDLYHGPHVDLAPDLVVLSNHGYDLKGKVNSDAVFGRTNLLGMHSQDDAFFFSTSGVQCTSIFDAKGILLKAFSTNRIEAIKRSYT
jgi:predicted AlkP superfamily phosphohydrolase/phosphomutase